MQNKLNGTNELQDSKEVKETPSVNGIVVRTGIIISGSEGGGAGEFITESPQAITLSGTGTSTEPLVAELNVSASLGNVLTASPAGAYVSTKLSTVPGEYHYDGEGGESSLFPNWDAKYQEQVFRNSWPSGGNNTTLLWLSSMPANAYWGSTYRLRVILTGSSHSNNVFKIENDPAIKEAGEKGFPDMVITLPDGSKLPAKEVVIPFPPDGEEHIYDVYPFHGPSIARVTGSTEGIPEAPIDGLPYVRQDGEWVAAGDGLDNRTSSFALLNGWSLYGLTATRKHGVVTLICDGVTSSTPNTLPILILPEWARPGTKISFGFPPHVMEVETNGEILFDRIDPDTFPSPYKFTITFVDVMYP